MKTNLSLRPGAAQQIPDGCAATLAKQRRRCHNRASWILPVLLLALPLVVRAQFSFVTNNGALTITGYTGPGGAVVIPAEIDGLPVTGIGDDAFWSCISLTSVTIPYGVTTIGADAFEECFNLTTVTMPDSLNSIGDYAFVWCSSLTSVAVPNSVTTLGESPFGACSSLTNVTIGNSVTNLGAYTFWRCSSLTSVAIPASVTTIASGAFYDCTSLIRVMIPHSVTSIGASAFYDCASLTSLTIPDSVTWIGGGAFYDCASLVSVTIPNSVDFIDGGAFWGCSRLTIVTIPDSVTWIGDAAFGACSNLTSVTVGNGVTGIDQYAFHDCTSLSSVCFEGNEPLDGGSIFAGDFNLHAVRYIEGTTGWEPTYDDIPAVPCDECGGWPPAIAWQPTSLLVGQGANAVFGVVVTGMAPFSYQWQLNGTNLADNGQIAGSQGNILTLAGVAPSDSGIYSVVVTNAFGSVTSNPAMLTVAEPPTITSQPTSATQFNGGSATFSVTVSGIGPFTYQWQLNGTNLPNGNIITVAGNGLQGYSGDGGQATNANLDWPSAVSMDSSGNLFIADEHNNCIRKVSRSGIITTVAGYGTAGYTGDGAPATAATLSYPDDVTSDGAGNLFIADSGNNVIRKVDTNGIIMTVAGNGTAGYSGDNGPATNATLAFPEALILDGSGNLFVADSANNVVREVDTNGNITTIAGSWGITSGGDGGAATNAGLGYPYGLALDASGDLLIGDFINNLVRQVSTNGLITTVAGTNSGAGYSGDSGPALNAMLNNPAGMAFDAYGDLFIADSGNNVIRQVDTNGIIRTVAGNGTAGFSGDGGCATNANLGGPYGLACDGSGNLLIADFSNNRVREVFLFAGHPVLTINNVTAGNAGYYSVVVSSPYSSVTSSVVSLTVSWPAPNFSGFGVTNGIFSFSWSTVSNLTYQVQYASDLGSTNWLDLGDPLTATGPQLSSSDAIGPDEQRFYRVVLLP